VAVAFESQSDGVVGVESAGAGLARSQIPVPDGGDGLGKLATLDLFDPAALENLAVVRDISQSPA